MIYIWTHDSIALGEDGPTHQPVEQLAGLRAMPNMTVRPAERRHRDGRGVARRVDAHGRPGGTRAHSPEAPGARSGKLAPASGLAQGAYVLADASRIGARRDPDRDRIGSVDCARRPRRLDERGVR